MKATYLEKTLTGFMYSAFRLVSFLDGSDKSYR